MMMKKIQILSACLLLGALLLSCAENRLNDGDPATVSGETVECRLPITVAPFQDAIAPGTRVQSDGKSAIEVCYGSQKDTRASEHLSRDEAKYTTINVFMFDVATSKITQWVKDALVEEGEVNCMIGSNGGKLQRIFVLANFPAPASLSMNLTLEQFLDEIYGADDFQLPAAGVAMIASQDIRMTGNMYVMPTFTLRPLLAKLSFKVNIAPDSGLLPGSFKYILYGYVAQTLRESSTEVLGRRASEYYTELAVSGPTPVNEVITYYVAPDYAGKVSSLTSATQRGANNAPLNAAYLNIIAMTKEGQELEYMVYLGDGTPQDFNLARSTAYNLTINIKGVDETDMRVGGLTTDLNKEDSRTANCYVVNDLRSDYSYLFNCTVMGSGVDQSVALDNPELKPTALAPQSVKVVWETGTVAGAVVKKVAFSDATKKKVRFWVGGAQGNAVIAVYASADGSGPALWSWHVWCTKDTYKAIPLADIVAKSGTFSPSGKTTMSGLVMMDRNLGALNATPQSDGSIGLLYQWGRKDPFPGRKSLTTLEGMPTTLDPTGSAIYPQRGYVDDDWRSVIENPGVFYTGDFNEGAPVKDDNTGDWYTMGDRDDDLWGTPLKELQFGGTVTIGRYECNCVEGVKTIFDPCPVGWRVPPAYIFANAPTSGTNTGFQASTGFTSGGNSIWFPATGSRGYNSAINWGNTTSGGYYTASPHHYEDDQGHQDADDYTAYASSWSFYSGSATGLVSNDVRATANSVRCVKE